MFNSINRSNYNDFYLQICSLANIDETPDETLKNPENVDKIEMFLDNYRQELTEDFHCQSVLCSLVDRISVVYEGDIDNKISELTKQLRNTTAFNESLNKWLKEAHDPSEKRQEAYTRIKNAWINQSTTLHLHCLNLIELPACIGLLMKVEDLNLQCNKLTSLPDAIGNLTQFETLSLMGNKLRSLPNAIGNLTQLQ